MYNFHCLLGLKLSMLSLDPMLMNSIVFLLLKMWQVLLSLLLKEISFYKISSTIRCLPVQYLEDLIFFLYIYIYTI